MIYTNPSNGVKEVSGVYYNPGNGVKTVQAVWENVGGHLYQIYPVAHTAYNGSTFSGALNLGLRSGINYYCSLYINSSIGTVARLNKIYPNVTGEFTGSPENYSLTSGTASFGFSNTTSTDNYQYYCGFISANLVNLALYDAIIVRTTRDENEFSNSDSDGNLQLCLTNEAGNATVTLDPASVSGDYADCTIRFDVSSVTDRRYIGFIFRLSARSTNYNYAKKDKRHITEIRFE